MLITLSINELKPGMFVERVAKQTQGAAVKVKTRGLVQSPAIIKRLVDEGVQELIIDFAQSQISPPKHLIPQAESAASKNESAAPAQKPKISDRDLQIASLEQEFIIAVTCYEQGLKKLRAMHHELLSGHPLNMGLINELAEEIVDSVFRNPDALTAMTLLREQQSYTWRHMLNSAILMAVFAKYLGYELHKVRQMALAALLHDIGLAKVPQSILSKPSELTPLERAALGKHVAYGVSMLRNQKEINTMMLEMVVNHHERIDGTGYPRGVNASKLTREARIMAIIDVYAAMIAQKPYRNAHDPISALRYLLSNENEFDHALVQRFIKCVGIYPIGSLVELSNDRLAIVTQGNEAKPICPKVKVIYNTAHRHSITAKSLDLNTCADVSIKGVVNAQDYDLNMDRLLKTHLLEQ